MADNFANKRKIGFTLAEGATLADSFANNRKFGFTLAEVLITLGIIGVVAAITLPSLIQNYKKHVIENQLKKAYSTLQNGIRLSEIDNGYMSEWPSGAQLDVQPYFNQYWKPYFVGIKQCSNMKACGYKQNYAGSSDLSKKWINALWDISTQYSSVSARILFQIADGTVIFVPNISAGQYYSGIYVDVNGPKEPNTYGLDVFTFTRNTDRGIKPTNGALLIMQNGWKIPKDYPYKY